MRDAQSPASIGHGPHVCFLDPPPTSLLAGWVIACDALPGWGPCCVNRNIAFGCLGMNRTLCGVGTRAQQHAAAGPASYPLPCLQGRYDLSEPSDPRMEPEPRKQKDSVCRSLAPRPPSKITMGPGKRAPALEVQDKPASVYT